MAYYEGEIAPMGNQNNGVFDWSGILGLIVVAGLFGGGFGFGGNRGNCATQADLAAGFNNSAVLSSLNDLKLGQQQGFSGVDNAVCTLGYNIQAGMNGISHQISDCCCQTQRAIDGLRYENAKNTCDIIRAGQDNTRSILDYLTNEKIAALQLENNNLKQSAYLINALRPFPIPSYTVPNPFTPPTTA